MRSAGRLAVFSLALAAGSGAAFGQSAVISARSGLIHYVEGQVDLAGQPIESKFGTFPEVKENQSLKTGEGRAEVLLTPGVFLRLGENSSFRMITNRLIDTRLELLSGSAIVEAEEIGRDNSVTVVYQDTAVHLAKKGLYRFDFSPGELRVFDGLAEVTSGERSVEARDGHLVALDTLAMRRFDKASTDALNRWSERRAEYVSMANVSAADSLRSSLFNDGGLSSYAGYGGMGYGGMGYGGMGYGGMGYGGMMGSMWYFNPFFGMYTFVPGMDGNFFSPYGFQFWSPWNVYMAYMPGYYYTPYSNYGGYGGNYGGRYGGRYGGYAGAYNSINSRSVPVPSRSAGGAIGSRGGVGSVASGHGPSGGGRVGGLSPGVGSVGSVARGGGAVGGGGGGHR